MFSLLLSLLFVVAIAAAGPLHPVLLIPGLASSKSVAGDIANVLHPFRPSSLTLYSSPLPGCPPDAKPWSLWHTPDTSTPAKEACWVLSMTTMYDAAHKTVNDTPGFVVDVPFYTSFDTNSMKAAAPLWVTYGYVINQTLFTAGFDWRIPSVGQAAYFDRLKGWIEHISSLNKNLPVDIVAESLGPQIVLGFLHRMTQAWKTKYVRWFVPESPLFAGSVMNPAAFASGYGGSNPKLQRELTLLTHTGLWLFPRPGTTNTSWTETEVIVKTPSKVYMAHNMTAMLTDLGFKGKVAGLDGLLAEPDLNDFTQPGVNTFVVYGTGLATAGSFVYSQDFIQNQSWVPSQPTVINDPEMGDGAVALRSSRRPLYAWPADMRKAGLTFYSKGYAGVYHANCIFQAGLQCFKDVVALLANNTVPSGLDPIPGVRV